VIWTDTTGVGVPPRFENRAASCPFSIETSSQPTYTGGVAVLVSFQRPKKAFCCGLLTSGVLSNDACKVNADARSCFTPFATSVARPITEKSASAWASGLLLNVSPSSTLLAGSL
jgi:hypothetical protein